MSLDAAILAQVSKGGGGGAAIAGTVQSSAPTGVAQSTTHLSITGSGWFLGIHSGQGQQSIVASLQIDGGAIRHINTDWGAGNTAGNPGVGAIGPVRFESSLVVTINSASSALISAWAVVE